MILHIILRVAIMWSWAASIGDWVSTNRSLAKPGISELNFFMRWLQAALGLKWVFARMALAQLVIFGTVHYYDNTVQAFLATFVTALVLTYVVISNWKNGN